ncbi:MAG: hypothetical protein ACREJD_12100 [Phycisphaerales bacterium]
MPAADQFLRAVDAYRRWLFVAAALLLLASFSPHWRITPDSAVFMGIARNLASGRGFTFSEEAVTSVNAGFPYLLLATRSLASDPVVAGNVLMLATGFASLVLVYLLMLRHAGRPLAVLVVVLTAINGTFLRHSCEILADIPFFFCCTLALLGYELSFSRRAVHEPGATIAPEIPQARVRRLALASLLVLLGLAGMASLRIVFLGPLAAILLDLLWRVRRSRFKWAVISAAIGVLFVALAIRLADPRMANGFTLLAKERDLLERLRNFPETASRIASFNAPQLFTDVTSRAIFGNKLGLWPLDVLVSLAVLAAGAILIRRRFAWVALIAIYFVQWLLIFPDSRYFLPVLPLLMLGWWDLSLLFASRMSLKWQRPVLTGLIAILVLPNLVRSSGFVIEQHQQPFLARYLRGRFQDLPQFARDAAAVLPADAVVITSPQFAAPFHYFSGFRTIPTIGATLLTPLPKARPVFALFPEDEDFDAAIKALKLARSTTLLIGPDRGPQKSLVIMQLK